MPSAPEPDRSDEPRIVQEALGQSEVFLQFQENLSRVAKVDRPVLLIGERGTGKELAAARLHYLSRRWQEPFVTLNCAALSPTLIESELFGHEAGAFTGAARRRTGRFEAATRGTLMLDEIGSIPLETQEKILRAVEYGTFERVGSSEAVRVDVRIIGATNANLAHLADEGHFMRDLLDRLSFDVLFLPPLRARREDIMLLASHFASRMAHELGWRQVAEFTEDAVTKLEDYPWPGNVRELKNVVERAVYRSDDNVITDQEVVFDPFLPPYEAEPLPARRPAPARESPETLPTSPAGYDDDQWQRLIAREKRALPAIVREIELLLIRQALEKMQFNQRKAADCLGITYHQFRGLFRKYRRELGE